MQELTEIKRLHMSELTRITLMNVNLEASIEKLKKDKRDLKAVTVCPPPNHQTTKPPPPPLPAAPDSMRRR